MPAHRSAKRVSSPSHDDSVSIWATTTQPQSIAFAPNLTPVTFNDPPPALDDTDSVLFPSSPDFFAFSPASESSPAPTPRRAGHNKKKPENHIPRPPNAFILFRSSFIKSQHVSTEVETNHSTLSKIIGLTWQNLPPEERAVWHAKAKVALDDHRRKFPQYAFRPLHPKKGGTQEKRRVREVGPKDIKRCETIAALLVQGKKGTELDAAIREFDKHHVPEVVTRFETPLTAGMYRRSASEPAKDQPFLPEKSAVPPPAPSAKRSRASSAQPAPVSAPELSNKEAETRPSSPVFAFPLKCEPSSPINFTSYSAHEDSQTLMQPQPQTPHSPMSFYSTPSPDSAYMAYSDAPTGPPSISLDTSSFVMNGDWTPAPSPSPLSSVPATPLSAGPTHLRLDMDLDMDLDMGLSLGMGLGCGMGMSMELGLGAGAGMEALGAYGLPCYEYGGVPPVEYGLQYPCGGEQGFAKPQLVHDADLSAFMASFSQYTV